MWQPVEIKDCEGKIIQNVEAEVNKDNSSVMSFCLDNLLVGTVSGKGDWWDCRPVQWFSKDVSPVTQTGFKTWEDAARHLIDAQTRLVRNEKMQSQYSIKRKTDALEDNVFLITVGESCIGSVKEEGEYNKTWVAYRTAEPWESKGHLSLLAAAYTLLHNFTNIDLP